MKTLLLFFFVLPLQLWAQSDTLKPIRTDSLKLIGTDLISGYGRYGNGVRSQYTYDGIDVRQVMDLEKYIRASGDVDANTEFDRYLNRRQRSVPLIVAGSLVAVGGIIGIAIARSAPDSRNPFQGPARSTTGPDGSVGLVISILGIGFATWGFTLRAPGDHVRRAVQYYNRALKQRGITWQLSPYSTTSNSGVGLAGRF